MKRYFPLAAAVVLAGGALPAAAQSPIEGRWAKGNLQIEIAPCGAVLCGTVVGATASQQGKAMRGSGTRLIGATLIHDIRPVGPNRYRAKVFVPDRNLHAAGTVHHVAPDRLDVAGCVMIVLCKTAHWRRIGR